MEQVNNPRNGVPRLKLVFLVFKQHVERRQRTVAARDVLLHLHLLAVGKFFVRVDLLLQHAQVVTHQHDFVCNNK